MNQPEKMILVPLRLLEFMGGKNKGGHIHDAAAEIQYLLEHADQHPGEASREAIADIKAYVERLVAASAGQQSVATGYLADIVAFIDERTKGDPIEPTDINELRMELQEARRSEFNSEVAYKAAIEKQGELRELLAGRDSLLRDIASDDLPGNVHPNYRQRASALLERNP